MVHIIKVHLEDSKRGNQIRRLMVSSDVVCNFKLLKEKIQGLFQLQSDYFEMKWKDSDDDFILMSSDEELAQALANAEDGVLRVYLDLKGDVQTVPKAPDVHEKNGVEHPCVTCDGCEKDIFGDRYKCLQCKNFDLCSLCNSANKHPDHDMVKLVKPAHMPREWVFCGARKIWKNMFGFCPANIHCREKEENKSASSSKPNPENVRKQCKHPQGIPDVFTNVMNGDLTECHRLITEGIGHFMNLLPAGVDIKLEQCPFKAECKVKPKTEKTCSKKQASTETCTETKQGKKVAKPENPAKPKKENSANPKKVETLPEPISPMKVKIPKTLPIPTPGKVEIPETLRITNVLTRMKECEIEALLNPTPVQVKTEETLPTPKKFETIGLFPVPTQQEIPEDILVSNNCNEEAEAYRTDSTRRVAFKENCPALDDSSNCAEGWTFIHEDETNKQELSCAAEATVEKATEAAVEKATEATVEKATEAAEAVHYPKLEEIKSKLEEGNVIQSSDPKIINALIKMQAMGFTNEGGWLERLLITKHGNINEALDALYPFSQRH